MNMSTYAFTELILRSAVDKVKSNNIVGFRNLPHRVANVWLAGFTLTSVL